MHSLTQHGGMCGTGRGSAGRALGRAHLCDVPAVDANQQIADREPICLDFDAGRILRVDKFLHGKWRVGLNLHSDAKDSVNADGLMGLQNLRPLPRQTGKAKASPAQGTMHMITLQYLASPGAMRVARQTCCKKGYGAPGPLLGRAAPRSAAVGEPPAWAIAPKGYHAARGRGDLGTLTWTG
jgi:hypothetical protein